MLLQIQDHIRQYGSIDAVAPEEADAAVSLAVLVFEQPFSAAAANCTATKHMPVRLSYLMQLLLCVRILCVIMPVAAYRCHQQALPAPDTQGRRHGRRTRCS